MKNQGACMEGQRSFGLKACLVVKAMFGGALLFIASYMYWDALRGAGLAIPLAKKIRLALFPAYFIFYLVICVFLFKLKRWARWVSVILDISIILYVLPSPVRDLRIFFRYGRIIWRVLEALGPFVFDLFMLALLAWFIYCLTRPQAGREFR